MNLKNILKNAGLDPGKIDEARLVRGRKPDFDKIMQHVDFDGKAAELNIKVNDVLEKGNIRVTNISYHVTLADNGYDDELLRVTYSGQYSDEDDYDDEDDEEGDLDRSRMGGGFGGRFSDDPYWDNGEIKYQKILTKHLIDAGFTSGPDGPAPAGDGDYLEYYAPNIANEIRMAIGDTLTTNNPTVFKRGWHILLIAPKIDASTIEAGKELIIRSMLNHIKEKSGMVDKGIISAIKHVRSKGIRWPELDAIEKSYKNKSPKSPR